METSAILNKVLAQVFRLYISPRRTVPVNPKPTRAARISIKSQGLAIVFGEVVNGHSKIDKYDAKCSARISFF